MSAILGALAILLCFFIGKSLFDEETGLVGSAAFAVSAYEIMYSGRGSGHADALFFLMLGMYLYVLSLEKRNWNILLRGSGVSLGLAITAHFNLLFFLPTIFILCEWLREKHESKGDFITRAKTFIIFLLLPFLTFEIFFLYLRIFTDFHFLSFFEQLFRVVSLNRYYLDLSAGILTYPALIWRLEGPLVSILSLFGFMAVLWQRRKKRFFLFSYYVHFYCLLFTGVFIIIGCHFLINISLSVLIKTPGIVYHLF